MEESSLEEPVIDHLVRVLADPGSGLFEAGEDADAQTRELGLENRRLGDVTLVREIGRGGMGVIFEGEDDAGGAVAVKLLAPWLQGAETLTRFHREVAVLESLAHPGIVRVLGSGTTGATHYYVMELLRGRPLSRVLLEKRILPREAADWGLQAARALGHCHDQGVLHRDIKPSNLFIEADGTVRLTDFGLALGTADSERITRSNVTLGTPAYMSPEQLLGQPTDARSEVYSLGATLYELLALTPPYESHDPRALLMQVLQGDVPPVRDHAPRVPPLLEAIVLKCLERDPGRRYPSMDAVAEDLAAFLDQRPVKARVYGWTSRLRRLVNRHRALSAALAGALIVAMGATAVWAVRGVREAQAQTARVVAATDAATAASARAVAFAQHVASVEVGFEARTPMARVAGAYTALRGEAQHARAACHDALRLAQAALAHAPADAVLRDLELRLYAHLASLAELTRDRAARDSWAQICAHLDHDGTYADVLAGHGTISVVTYPPAAEVRVGTLWRVEPPSAREALLVPDEPGEAESRLAGGGGPLRLPKGSHYLRVRAPGHTEAIVPFVLRHGQALGLTCRLVPEAKGLAGFRHVPAGRGLVGAVNPWRDSVGALRQLQRPVRLGGFLIGVHEVRIREYREYVRALWDAGERERARQMIPRHGREALWAFDDAGRVVLAPNRTARQLERWVSPEKVDAPVTHVALDAARAYARWVGQRIGRACRLPTALEWERAATGVDGRTYPWGYALVPGAANTLRFADNRQFTTRPLDRSPYGIRDLYGSASEWTGTPAKERPRQLQEVRGQNLESTMPYRVNREQQLPRTTRAWIGIRLLIPLGDE